MQNWVRRLTSESNGTKGIKKQDPGVDVGTQDSVQTKGQIRADAAGWGSCVFVFSDNWPSISTEVKRSASLMSTRQTYLENGKVKELTYNLLMFFISKSISGMRN